MEKEQIAQLILETFSGDAKIENTIETSSFIKVFFSLPLDYGKKKLEKGLDDLENRLSSCIANRVTSGSPFLSVSVSKDKKALLKSPALEDKNPTLIPLGMSDEDKLITLDIRKAPHILIAGTTGSGKSILSHSIIKSLINRSTPEQLKLALIDPKRVEFNRYKEDPHLYCPIVKDPCDIEKVLDDLAKEVETRFEKFMEVNARDIDEYNASASEKLPYIILLADEFADVQEMVKTSLERFVRIAQRSRAAGIHLILATQRSTPKVLSGALKANFPTKIALCLTSPVDSMTIIGTGKATKLYGHGDMLIQCPVVDQVSEVRAQGFYDL